MISTRASPHFPSSRPIDLFWNEAANQTAKLTGQCEGSARSPSFHRQACHLCSTAFPRKDGNAERSAHCDSCLLLRICLCVCAPRWPYSYHWLYVDQREVMSAVMIILELHSPLPGPPPSASESCCLETMHGSCHPLLGACFGQPQPSS